jgi:hypothetical protein
MKWYKLQDHEPPRCTGILVTDGVTVTAAKKDGEYWFPHEVGGYEWEWDFDIKKVTHWMPLPKPPND